MRRERIDGNFSFVCKLLKRLHIPVFRPSDVSERIVDSFFFVIEIVATGPVRAGHSQFEFFRIELRVSVKAGGDVP